MNLHGMCPIYCATGRLIPLPSRLLRVSYQRCLFTPLEESWQRFCFRGYNSRHDQTDCLANRTA